MKLIEPRPFIDPDKAARKLVEIANDAEVVIDSQLGAPAWSHASVR